MTMTIFFFLAVLLCLSQLLAVNGHLVGENVASFYFHATCQIFHLQNVLASGSC